MPEYNLQVKVLVSLPSTLEMTVEAQTLEEAVKIAQSRASNADVCDVELGDDGWVDFDSDGDPDDPPVKQLIDGELYDLEGNPID